MKFEEYAEQIRAIGREVNPDTLAATRAVVTPLYTGEDGAGVHVARDVQYGDDARHRLDIFTPAGSFDPDRPLLLFVHGGGFIAGDKHTEGSPFYSNIGYWAVRNGCNAVTMTYRLAPVHQWPSGLQDIHLAIRFLQDNGQAHGVGTERLFLMGQSAGAAHAAHYVSHAHLYQPHAHGLAGLICLSGLYNFVTDQPGPLEQAYLGTDTSQYAARSSLQGLVDSGIPLLMTLAEFDPPPFQQQGLQLLSTWHHRHGQLPRFVQAIGQNHLSVALYFGLAGDLVGPQVKAFIEAVG
jgi:acetyl esterase/lipase